MKVTLSDDAAELYLHHCRPIDWELFDRIARIEGRTVEADANSVLADAYVLRTGERIPSCCVRRVDYAEDARLKVMRQRA